MNTQDAYRFFDAGSIDKSRPAGRPPKTNRKVELMKKLMRFAAQYVAPEWTAATIWKHFTHPGRTRWSEKQKALLEQASRVETFENRGTTLYRYRWGADDAPKILLVHGWRSKAVDFRRMIERLRNQGFTVDALDMRAHGQSEGTNTALPEYYEVLKQHYGDWGPYHAVAGYSLGGLATGLVMSQLPAEQQPEKLFLIGAPPYAFYFFEDIIAELKLGKHVLRRFANRVGAAYDHPIEWWDLRQKAHGLAGIETHLIYDEDDETIPFEKGKELWPLLPNSTFFHTKGLGHYKIITHEAVIEYMAEQLPIPELV